MIGNANHEKGIADNQPNLVILGVLVKLAKKAFLFEKTNGRPRLVHMLELILIEYRIDLLHHRVKVL